MMIKTQKQKLEEQMNLQRESLKEGLISKYEYYLAITKIREKMKELNRKKRQEAKKNMGKKAEKTKKTKAKVTRTKRERKKSPAKKTKNIKKRTKKTVK
ncbi:MAG: hypothetical protein KJ574_04935, partial [Nanoarchaeota archaeon]|nr:hypothetical protein [Nanoarchaeota archaeon]